MNEALKGEKESCKLQESIGIEAWCTREKCIYWRLLEPQEVNISNISNEVGCGLEHHMLIDELNPEMSEWLMQMKRRLEKIAPEEGKARISFKKREEE